MPSNPPPSRALFIDAGWRLALLGGGVTVAAAVLMPLDGLDWRGAAAALFAYGAVAALVLAGLAWHAPHRRFGPANAVTLARAAAMALLVGVLAESAPLTQAGRWLLAGGGTAALLLDGVDGWVARRTGLASAFGARFDMEVDALFVLVLSALVWRAGQAGAWVLTAGLMRYIFVMAGRLWPALAGPLPASFRRKAVCVITIVVLLVALSPALGGGKAGVLCLAGLCLLGYSFAADTAWLLVAPRHQASAVTTLGVGAPPC
jgi:phosphatidylglycerophosphate synthase